MINKNKRIVIIKFDLMKRKQNWMMGCRKLQGFVAFSKLEVSDWILTHKGPQPYQKRAHAFTNQDKLLSTLFFLQKYIVGVKKQKQNWCYTKNHMKYTIICSWNLSL